VGGVRPRLAAGLGVGGEKGGGGRPQRRRSPGTGGHGCGGSGAGVSVCWVGGGVGGGGVCGGGGRHLVLFMDARTDASPAAFALSVLLLLACDGLIFVHALGK